MSHSTKVTLKIIPFRNPGGSVAFRVSGTVYGERIQKNFSTRSVAETYLNGLLAVAGQGQSSDPQRLVMTTFVRDADLHDAQLAFARLRAQVPRGSLVTAVDFYLEHAGQFVRDCDAEDALDRFSEHRRRRGNQDKTVTNGETILRKFLRDARVKKISDFTPKAAKTFIFDPKVGTRTRRDRHGLLHNWAEFLKGEKHLTKNFIEEIDRPRVIYDGVISTLTADQVRQLLRAAVRTTVGRGRRRRTGPMLAYFAVCSLCGVRPEEAQRLRGDFKWFSREHRLITGFRAKRPDAPRTVECDENLVEILEYCRQHKFAPSDFTVKGFIQTRTAAGLMGEWDNDILRHAYASHHYACRKDMNYLVKNMGNSADVLLRSYLDQTIPSSVGERYLSITLKDILDE